MHNSFWGEWMNVTGLFSVRVKLVLVIGALLTAISVFLFAFFPPRMEQISNRWAERRAQDVTRVIADAVAAGLEFDSETAVNETLSGLKSARDTVYAVVFKADGAPFAGWNIEKAPAASAIGNLEQVHYRGEIIDVSIPVTAKGGTRGTLVVGFSVKQATQEAEENRWTVLEVSGLVFAIGLVLAFFIGTLVTRPIVALRHATERIVIDGDLTQQIDVTNRDEVGQLAATFVKMVERLRSIPINMRESADLLTDTVQRLSSSTSVQGQAVTRQAAGLQETQVTAQEIRQTSVMAAQKAQAILQIAERAEDVSSSGEKAIEESRRGLNEIRSLVDDIARKIKQLGERTQVA